MPHSPRKGRTHSLILFGRRCSSSYTDEHRRSRQQGDDSSPPWLTFVIFLPFHQENGRKIQHFICIRFHVITQLHSNFMTHYEVN
jgi:hypothetical protein